MKWHLSNYLGFHGSIITVQILVQMVRIKVLCSILINMDNYAVKFPLGWNKNWIWKVELDIPNIILKCSWLPCEIDFGEIESIFLLTIHWWSDIHINNSAIKQSIDGNILVGRFHQRTMSIVYILDCFETPSFNFIINVRVYLKLDLHSSKLINRYNLSSTIRVLRIFLIDCW